MARLTPEEYAALKAKAKPLVPAKVTAPSPDVRQQSRAAEETSKSTASALAADTARKERIRADIAIEKQKRGADFSQEVARLNAEADVKASAPPIYMGAYDPGLTTPLFGSVSPARPMNIAVPKAEAPGFLEAMRPQVMAPPVSAAISASRTAKVFDDSAFMQTIADLPPAEKQRAIDTHSAFKNAFFKLREMNPVETGVTDEELLKDLRQQITDFETGKGPTLTQGRTNRGDIGGALERQVTPATLQIARPGALTYFSELSSKALKAGGDAAAKTAIENLRKNGIPVMAPVPGNREGLERQVGTRPASPADINRVGDAARRAYTEANPIPLSMLANRDELLANSEKSATGGTLFQKEYITGATVESSLSHALRSAFSLPNYIAGAAIDLVTPESTRMREQAGRPAGMKDVSPGVYNVATGGGFFKPIQDLWTYSPVESVRDNAWIGSTFGLAADLLSLEAGAIGGLASGGRAMLGTTKALGVAGETSALRAAGRILAEGGKTAAATTAKSIGLPSLAKAIAPGDLRLVGASSVAENYKALAAYEDDIANGGIHNSAMQAAQDAAPNSFAVQTMAKQGPSFSPAAFLKDSKAEYDEFKAIDDTINAVIRGDETVDTLKLRPYLKGGMTDNAAAAILEKVAPSVPEGASEEAKLIAGQKQAGAKFTRTTTVKNVVDAIKNSGNLNGVRDAAAFDKGFKAIDRSVGALEPGKEVIAITPRTFGTKKKADEVIAAAKETDASKLIAKVTGNTERKSESIQFTLGGREVTDTGYMLTTEEVKDFIKVLTTEANTGTIPNASVNKAIQELSAKAISSKTIRELTYSIVDGVAEQIRVKNVAPTLRSLGSGTFAATGLSNKAKAIAYGAQTNSVKLTIEKVAKQLTSGIGQSEDVKLARMLDDVQLESVRAAKSKVGQVDKMLVSEFEALDDPTIAARYDLGPNPDRSQKMAAITLGEKPNLLNKKTTLYNYLKSTLFGTTNLTPWRFFGDFTPAKGFEYSTFEQIFNPTGLAEVDKIVDKYAVLVKTPDDMLNLLPQMTNEVEELTKRLLTVEKESVPGSVGYAPVGTATNAPAFLTEEFSSKVTKPGIFKLARPEEALIGTYARNKADEIFTDAMSSILAYDPLTSGTTTRTMSQFKLAQTDKIVQRAVAHQLSGGAPIISIEDLLSIKGMSAILDMPLNPLIPSEGTIGQVLSSSRDSALLSTLIEDINATSAVVARKFGGGVPSVEYANELQQIANGNIKLSELGDAPNPFSLRHAVRASLGTEAKYGDLISELGKIAEQEAAGSVSAARTSRYFNSLLDTFNSVFYNAMLSYRPRFHGRNILSAPFIVNMTTGLALGPNDMLRGARVLDPVSVQGAGKALMEEGRVAGGFAQDIKNDVIVVDKLGNQYTSLELYKLAVESGILKTEMSANVDARFLDEAKALGLGQSPTAAVTRVFPGPMKALSYPSYMANAEDNMWRMATVIHAIEGGDTIEGALQLGRRSLFDFGSASAFERKYIARKVLFWNYFRNSVLQGVKTLLENPGRVLKQYRLATDVSKIMVGDTDWNNLRFYGPMDAGVANIAMQYAPSNRREGQVTVTPNLPYADFAAISAGLLYSPIDFLAGQKDLITGERDYGKGFIIGKLSPGSRATFNFVAGQTMDDVKMAKNQMSPTHIAAAAAFENKTGVPAVTMLTEYYNAKPRPALPGEKAYDGIVYELSPKDFDNYKMYLVKTIQYTGTSAAVNEWAKLYSGTDLAGSTATTYSEAIGLTSKYAAPSPESLQRGAADISTGMLEAGTREKEVEAGLTRPKAPSAAGRVK